ncbi:MAG TPA: PadR family transcriptional regulator [Terriglobales bacterium]|nr:PadR family transcriptional regulator [Terriglobales bacterium]
MQREFDASVPSTEPLTPALFHVLLALADGDKHGYAIMKEVHRLTAGAANLSAGTLYGILRRLLEAGLVTEVSSRPAPELDDERRRYYHLTKSGHAAAQAETERLEATLAIARSKRFRLKARTS